MEHIQLDNEHSPFQAPQEKEENVRAIIRPSHFTYSDNNVDYAIARKNFKPRPLYSYYE